MQRHTFPLMLIAFMIHAVLIRDESRRTAEVRGPLLVAAPALRNSDCCCCRRRLSVFFHPQPLLP